MLNELVTTKRYKESNYKIFRLDGDYYGIHNSETNMWAELSSPNFGKKKFHLGWESECKGSLRKVITTYQQMVPEIISEENQTKVKLKKFLSDEE